MRHHPTTVSVEYLFGALPEYIIMRFLQYLQQWIMIIIYRDTCTIFLKMGFRWAKQYSPSTIVSTLGNFRCTPTLHYTTLHYTIVYTTLHYTTLYTALYTTIYTTPHYALHYKLLY